MAWLLCTPLGALAILVLAGAIVKLIRALLRRRLAQPDERGAVAGGALAGSGPEREDGSQRVQPRAQRARSLAHTWPPPKQSRNGGRKQWLADMRSALAARAAGEPIAAAAAAPPARPNPSPPETSQSSPSPLQPHRTNSVNILRQPSDALLVELRLATARTLDERYARRDREKVQSPLDPEDADSLRALRIESRDELASDRDPRRVGLCLRLNRFDRSAY